MYAERAINQTPGRGNLGIFSLRYKVGIGPKTRNITFRKCACRLVAVTPEKKMSYTILNSED